MDIASVFDAAAEDYDATRKKYISCFDDFYGVAIQQIPYKPEDVFNVLDLGAGTGLFSALIRGIFSRCEITLSDAIAGKYDVVIPALSLHHSTEQ